MQNEFDLVFKDVLQIYKMNGNICKCIADCKYPTIKNNNIGFSGERISYDQYNEIFELLSMNGDYFIKFVDDSLLSFQYNFDNNNICAFKIEFIPSPLSKILFKTYDTQSVVSKYLRIDYDPISYKKIVHPKIHLHNSLSRDGLRIPLDNLVIISEFLYVIIRYFYNEDSPALKSWIQKAKFSTSNFLDSIEKNLLFLSMI